MRLSTLRNALPVLVTVAVLMAAGCQRVGDAVIAPAVEEAADAAGQASVADDLRQLYSIYIEHHDVHGQGPAGWDELLAYTGDRAEEKAAITRLRDLGYQVSWGLRLQDATQGTMNTVLAQSPGNSTLMLDGSIAQ
jgi:hypothetical protein